MIIHPASKPALSSREAVPVRVCSLEDLPVGLGRAFEVGGRTLAFFRTRRGGVFAVDNRCPHKGGPLAEGMLAGDAVVCPLHAFKFDLATGACDQPGACPVSAYPVSDIDGEIFITLPPPGREIKESE
jgi:nitrite reductase (NADH) small subunit